jgi:hypothetical protein
MRQGRDPKNWPEAKWRRYCDASANTPGFECWGAFVEGRLAAFMVTALVDGYFSILTQCSAAEYLDCQPNNALVFTVTQRKLACPEVECVSYGLKSVDMTSGLNRFKERMGFELVPFTENLLFNPYLKTMLDCGGRAVIRGMALRFPGNDFWRKASRVLELTTEEGLSLEEDYA